MSAGERAFSIVRNLLATSPPLKRGMFALDPSVIQPWTDKPQEPSNPFTVDTSGTVLSPDGLMWGETKDDFFRMDEGSDSVLVSRSVAEKLGIAEPKRDAEGNAITAQPEVRAYTAPRSSIPCKRPRSPEPVPDPQAGGSAAATAAELAAVGSSETTDAPKEAQQTEMPYLRQRIAPDDLPEVLLVRARWEGGYCDYEYNNPSARWDCTDDDTETMVYVRVMPPPRSFDQGETDAQPKLGFACLEGDGPIGKGNSGAAWKCVFAPDMSVEEQACFKAVAKVENVNFGGYGKTRVQQFMRDEAQTYTALPDWMSDDYTGYAIVPTLDTPQPVTAIVPKFYGLYARACWTGPSLEEHLARTRDGDKSKNNESEPGAKDDKADGEAASTQVGSEHAPSVSSDSADSSAESTDSSGSDSEAKIESGSSDSPSACDLSPTTVESECDCQQTAGVSNEQQQGAQAVGGSQAGQDAKEGAGPTAAARPTWRVINLLEPILLLEDCGEPIIPSSLSEDEKKEIYSMVLRFHRAGFMQNSPYRRNFVQRTEETSAEDDTPKKKFRMIDLGRGALVGHSRWEPSYQEEEARSELGLELEI